MEQNSEEKPAQAVVAPEPDHVCVFICDLQIVKGCLERSLPIAYGLKESKGWRVISTPDETVICYPCYEQFA